MACSIGPWDKGSLREQYGGGTWGREARRVLLLAAELAVELDANALPYCDVRELMALRRDLRAALTKPYRTTEPIPRSETSRRVWQAVRPSTDETPRPIFARVRAFARLLR